MSQVSNRIEPDNRCTFCGACIAICPVDAIDAGIDVFGFSYPQVDDEKCINCGKCTKVCMCGEKSEDPCE